MTELAATTRVTRLCGRLSKTEHHTEGPHNCDDRCGPLRDHRTTRPHACDHRCVLHQCTPLASSSRLKVLSIVSAALSLAKQYKWIDENPAEAATMPRPGDHEPDPPTPEQAAALLGHAEGSTTLRYYAQFTRPADQRAAAVIPAQLDELRKKERLRELFRQLPDVPDDLVALGPQAGLTAER